VLVVESLSAAPQPGRRRRRARPVDPAAPPRELPLTRVTAVRAAEPFEGEGAAERWLREASEAEETVDRLIEDAIRLLNRALHAQAAASADPFTQELARERAVAARIGFGSGDEVAAGLCAAAREVDVGAGGLSRRRQRTERLRPQERVAAVLGGRERVDACETLLLRARADLDAGRSREAALQLRVGLEALLAELRGAVADPDHERDMVALEGAMETTRALAESALKGDLDAEAEGAVTRLLETAERVLRRRRVLRGG
jgi:hypothetical protein